MAKARPKKNVVKPPQISFNEIKAQTLINLLQRKLQVLANENPMLEAQVITLQEQVAESKKAEVKKNG